MADKKKSIIPTIILSVISIIWIYPIVMILFNSLKVESAITTSGDLSYVCCFDSALLLYVRMVHCTCKRLAFQGSVLPLRIQYGCSFPDGYVYPGKNSRYFETE